MTFLDISNEDFQNLADLVQKRAGIYLPEKKKLLLRNRLNSFLAEKKFASFSDYYNYIKQSTSVQDLLLLIDKLSTNYTYFYRESEHFEFLISTVFPELKRKKDRERSFRMWSAGCSGGDEPYTLAMIAKEYFSDDITNWDPKILATDISLSALKEAEAGVYLSSRVSKLPDVYLKRYFTLLDNGMYKIKDHVKQNVLIRRLNLMRHAFPFKNKFSVIFCRNVMIYFDTEDRDRLIRHFSNLLEEGGYLFVGHSESLISLKNLFHFVKPGVYKKKGKA